MAWQQFSSAEPRYGTPARAALLREVCDLLRLGRLDAAHTGLLRASGWATGDAAWLNLIGVISEARGQPKEAKRYYCRAIRADRRFGPAQQNMRRLYELNTLGRSALAPAVGDALTDLWLDRQTALRRRP